MRHGVLDEDVRPAVAAEKNPNGLDAKASVQVNLAVRQLVRNEILKQIGVTLHNVLTNRDPAAGGF
jgi:hypothetical protein